MTLARLLLTAVSLTCLTASVALAEDAEDSPATALKPVSKADAAKPVTRGELPALVKETLINNPDILVEAFKEMRKKQEADSKEAAQKAFVKNKDKIYRDNTSPSLGNPRGTDVTIVEFFDYHCGYCKQMLPVITKLTNEDKKVRVIFREFPILSDDSVMAARAALAVHKIDKNKYFAFHTALMNTKGKFDERMLMEVAKNLGISSKELKTQMDSKEVSDMLEANRKLAQEFGIRGTPAILIGDQMMPGAVPYDNLKAAIEDIRAGRKASD